MCRTPLQMSVISWSSTSLIKKLGSYFPSYSKSWHHSINVQQFICLVNKMHSGRHCGCITTLNRWNMLGPPVRLSGDVPKICQMKLLKPGRRSHMISNIYIYINNYIHGTPPFPAPTLSRGQRFIDSGYLNAPGVSTFSP